MRHPRRRTAEHLAAAQRDISVSEFFAKNRHLLGFDNPRKALLTTVKEAVDNALDACEEAGIIPEVWVRVAETGTNRYKVTVQDNGPGIVSKQIPLIFGKLLYGSKFHRLRMSRGQQGIGISAAGMYGVMTTGQPVRIVSKTSARKPAHYFEIQIDTKKNKPEILNGKGEGVDIPAGERGKDLMARHGIEWPEGIEHGTRVTIELEARFQRGRGSVDEYLEQTAIANPHARLHYGDAEGQARTYERSTDHLPPEPKEIKPHPYGVELGMLALMARDTGAATMAQFLTGSFSRVSPLVARNICEKAKLSIRTRPAKLTREEVEAVYRAIEVTKITAPSMDCLVPIGEELLLKGLRQVVPGQFYAAATRPPAVYRGNPFLIEVALAYGGASAATKVSREALKELLAESDARTLRQFLAMTFAGMGTEGADKIVRAANLATRQTPGKLKPKEIDALYESIQNVNLDEGQTMTVMRFANRVPLQFQQGACAITQTLMGTNWRAYGLAQSRGSLPSGPVTVMVHIASVWVPFTSESKEAVASYPEIQREIRLALQAVGRKLGMYVRRKERVQSQGERRNVFLRYIGEVSRAVGEMTGEDHEALYNRLFEVAKRKTAEADVQLDDRGRPLEQGEEDFGGSVLIVEEPSTAPAAAAAPPAAPESAEPKKK
ncbi:MAG: DNA topoisomerase VI subunit B [Planctomycetia bacterium]|nr:DNA topoisomerase VI subunit B [Planctomycetia bacterium]